VGLGDKRYQRIDGYSTGMKQRVKLAQAIAHDPKLLFLDEPTNGLDPAGREEMLTLIAELPTRSGCAVVLSSHLLHDVERVCERAILLHEGTMLYSGRIDELRAKGQEDVYEVRVKAGSDEMARALEARQCKVERDQAMLIVKLPRAATTDLVFGAAEASGLQVRHLQPRRLTLENAYVRAVNEARA
jgi:ABC-2 type transport system ATP-binding protein